MKKYKIKLSLASFVILSLLLVNSNVYADCDVDSCGNGEPSLEQNIQQTTPTNHHQLVLGILIGIGITLLVFLCVSALAKIRKKHTSR